MRIGTDSLLRYSGPGVWWCVWTVVGCTAFIHPSSFQLILILILVHQSCQRIPFRLFLSRSTLFRNIFHGLPLLYIPSFPFTLSLFLPSPPPIYKSNPQVRSAIYPFIHSCQSLRYRFSPPSFHPTPHHICPYCLSLLEVAFSLYYELCIADQPFPITNSTSPKTISNRKSSSPSS